MATAVVIEVVATADGGSSGGGGGGSSGSDGGSSNSGSSIDSSGAVRSRRTGSSIPGARSDHQRMRICNVPNLGHTGALPLLAPLLPQPLLLPLLPPQPRLMSPLSIVHPPLRIAYSTLNIAPDAGPRVRKLPRSNWQSLGNSV